MHPQSHGTDIRILIESRGIAKNYNLRSAFVSTLNLWQETLQHTGFMQEQSQ